MYIKKRPGLLILFFIFTIFQTPLYTESGKDLTIKTYSYNGKSININYKIIEIEKMSDQKMTKEKYEKMIFAQLIQAEAGNQDLIGMCYVADVVLNRVRSDRFPNTITEVIFQENQFSVIKDGSFNKVASNISDNALKAVELECNSQLNYDILYFGVNKSKYADDHFKYQDHWFGW